jgi:hypothetical protein
LAKRELRLGKPGPETFLLGWRHDALAILLSKLCGLAFQETGQFD